MYTRKWKHMNAFERMRMHSELYINRPPESYKIFSRFQPYYGNAIGSPVNLSEEDKQDQKLINNLFKYYPDLRYVTSNYSQVGSTSLKQGNYIYDFIFHQKNLIKKGYTEAKAFEMTEQKFQSRFNDKVEAYKVASQLAFTNDARSLLSRAQQQAELEATLKVKRMTRDLTTYEEAQKEINKTLKDIENDRYRRFNDDERVSEGDAELEGLEAYEIPEGVNVESSGNRTATIGGQTITAADAYAQKYTKVLYKIVPESQDNEFDVQRFNKAKRDKIINEFISNTKTMFNSYYERVAAMDKLSGLTDTEIMDAVASRPKRIKKQSQELLKKLDKYGIRLNSKGEVDYSNCPYPNVIRQLKDNPLVKTVLMQNDLMFESPIQESQHELARKAKQEMNESKKEREREELEKKEEERKAKEAASMSTEEQSPFHQQYNISYPKAEVQFTEEKKMTAKELAEKSARDSAEGLSAEATYRVFETYEERMARLEKKWLKSRLASLEGGIEKPTEDEKRVILDNAVEKLRRLKHLVDQKNLSNAKDLLFEEHKVFTKEELLVDGEVAMEKLTDYLKQSDEKRRLHTIDEIDDNTILNMIQRKEVVEDTLRPFRDNHLYRKTEADSFEFKQQKLNKLRKARLGADAIGRDQSVQGLDEDEEAPIFDDEVEATTTGKGKAKTSKVEKKKLIDYIRETTEANAARDAKKEAKAPAKKGK